MKSKITEEYVLKMTCNLLHCHEAHIEKAKTTLFMVVKHHDELVVVASGDTLEGLWKNVLAYSKSLTR